jgi:hypothetical protein
MSKSECQMVTELPRIILVSSCTHGAHYLALPVHTFQEIQVSAFLESPKDKFDDPGASGSLPDMRRGLGRRRSF